jgi:hypothetical protein
MADRPKRICDRGVPSHQEMDHIPDELGATEDDGLEQEDRGGRLLALTGPKPGDSAVQRRAEAAIIAGLATELGIPLGPGRVDLPNGVHVHLDGLSSDPPVLVEAWAHQGPVKPAQKAKVMTDALKLLWIERWKFRAGARKILALADRDAAEHFLGPTWMATALRELDIEVKVVSLSHEVRSEILAAQKRQFR